MKCEYCGSDIAPGANYCESCGAEVLYEKRICEKCGAKLQIKAKYCTNCGARIEPSENISGHDYKKSVLPQLADPGERSILPDRTSLINSLTEEWVQSESDQSAAVPNSEPLSSGLESILNSESDSEADENTESAKDIDPISSVTEVVEAKATDLLNIFTTDETRYGNDLLTLTGLFNICINRLYEDASEKSDFSDADVAPIMVSLLHFLKGGIDYTNGNLLVADFDHLDRDIIKKIRQGIYKVGESKQIDGNLRAIIVDDKNKFVKQITLKKYNNPSAVLSDMQNIAVIGMLQDIQESLNRLSNDVLYLIKFTRRNTLQTPFFNARNAILEAAYTEDEAKRTGYVEQALKYLREGLTSIYGDLNDNLEALARLHNQFSTKLEDIDKCLSYITEDIHLLPKYISVSIYLNNYVGSYQSINHILADYRYNIRKMIEEELDKKGHTAIQLIHMNYAYTTDNLDYWLTSSSEIYGLLTSKTNYELSDSLDIYKVEMNDQKKQEKAESDKDER